MFRQWGKDLLSMISLNQHRALRLENAVLKTSRLSVYTQLAAPRDDLGVKFSELSEISPKHFRRVLPIHAVTPVPPVQGIRQALPEITGIALQWGSE